MDKPKKNICIVSPSLKMGGIERALSVLANYFVAQGYTVHFISCLGGEKFYELDDNVNFIEPSFKRSGKFGKFRYYGKMVAWLRRHLTNIHPDAVLTFGDNFNPLVLLAASGLKYRIFVSDRTSPDFKFHPVINFLKKRLYPKAAGFIAQTERAYNYKKNLFGNRLRMKIIPNAIKHITLYDKERKKQILYLGRLSFEKGPDRLLEAFAKINNTENWKLVMAGNGPLMQQLKDRAHELKIADNVEFPGQITDIDEAFSESSIFVLPSRLEGFPNALCEAMSAGLAVICFDSIPSSDILTDGIDGYVVAEGDTDALAGKMQFLIDNETERKKIADKALLIRERLSLSKISDMYLNFMFPDN